MKSPSTPPILLFLLLLTLVSSNEPNSPILSRKRRYVAFPEGSTFIFGFCMMHAPYFGFNVFTEAVNWSIAYEMPNSTTYQSFLPSRNPYLMKRRHRRDLYNKFETIIDSMGFDGKSCIYRALCEAPRKLLQDSLGERILNLLFRFPQQSLSYSEPEDHRLYHSAFRVAQERQDESCEDLFKGCPFSLIDLALGNYKY